MLNAARPGLGMNEPYERVGFISTRSDRGKNGIVGDSIRQARLSRYLSTISPMYRDFLLNNSWIGGARPGSGMDVPYVGHMRGVWSWGNRIRDSFRKNSLSIPPSSGFKLGRYEPQRPIYRAPESRSKINPKVSQWYFDTMYYGQKLPGGMYGGRQIGGARPGVGMYAPNSGAEPLPPGDNRPVGPRKFLQQVRQGIAKTIEFADAEMPKLTDAIVSAGQSAYDMMNGIDWAGGGNASGSAWGGLLGFAGGAADAVNNATLIIKALTMGNSPPKKGPLRNIDKGGHNIGSAWGGAFSTAALESIHRGARDVKHTIDAQSRDFAHRGNMDMTLHRNDKKHVQISLNVTGDGSANRATMSELRKGLMDALIMADLEHMVEVI